MDPICDVNRIADDRPARCKKIGPRETLGSVLPARNCKQHDERPQIAFGVSMIVVTSIIRPR